MFGIANGASPWIVAAIAGAASAARPVGVAILLPLALYGWDVFGSSRLRLMKLTGVLLIGCWGLGAFMAYQAFSFGDPLAFAKGQEHYRLRPVNGVAHEIIAYAAWEPLWSVYDKQSPAYWGYRAAPSNPLINLRFANPIIFMGMVLCVALGAWKQWLTRYEVVLSCGLLAIPYFTRAYDMAMVAHGRFAAICFPGLLVIGELLRRAGLPVAATVLLGFAFYLCVYSGLFAVGYHLN
jgi:hypothetical protein